MTAPAPPAARPPVDASRWRALGLSVAAGALGYLAFSLWAGWHDVAAAVRRAGLGGVAVLLLLSAGNYGLRFLRWQLYLRELGARVPARASLGIYLAGFALTTTPGKAGEAVRSVFLARHGVPVRASLAAFFSERLSDLVAIVVLAALGVAGHASLQPLVAAALVACLAVFALLNARTTLARWHAASAASASRAGRAAHAALGVACAAARCHRAPVLAAATALSLAAWACEAWAFHLLLEWLGMPGPWRFGFFVYAVGMLAGALSFLPGGLGSTEAVMVGLLLWAGHAQPDAIAATVLIRVCTLWFAVALGAGALGALLRGQRRDAAPAGAGIATGGGG